MRGVRLIDDRTSSRLSDVNFENVGIVVRQPPAVGYRLDTFSPV